MFNEVGILHDVLGFLLGFVCGSIPTGLWLVKMVHGIDIREYGSKNIGTTNVFRTVGPLTAVLVLIGDMLKGLIPLFIANYLWHDPILDVCVALGAFMGHNYSCFLGFKGGKGVATSLGLILFLLPKTAAGCFVIWTVLVIATRYVSLGSIVAAAVAPFLTWYFGYPLPYILFAVIAGGFIVLRHKDNIGRLLSGTESKIKPGSAKDIKK